MEIDFRYLFLKHGDGARYIFENACDRVFKKEFEKSFSVKCNPGDEGIDVFVGDFDKPITVFQCKFFPGTIGDSQKKQIRDSFKKANESKEYKMKEWNLCIPKALDIQEHKWWASWKSKTSRSSNVKIELKDSTALLTLLRKHKIDEEIFDLDERKYIQEIHEYLIQREESIKEILSKPPDIDYSNSVFISKLKSAKINEHLMNYERQFFNAEILEKTINSKGVENEITELSNLKLNIHDLWLTQFIKNAENSNGNKLLGGVNERIEDLSETNLRTSIDVSVIEKKGILHQFAENCEVGWVKNYKEKLVFYERKKSGNKG